MPSPIPVLTHPSAPPPTWRIELDLLDPNPHQPRSHIDERALAELIASIRNHGLLQPITVRKLGARYQLIAGHRRLEAFRRLCAESKDFDTIPAHEKFDVSDEEMALFALIENLQRDDLSLLDAALGLLRFQDAHQLSTDALAMGHATIEMTMRYAHLSPHVRRSAVQLLDRHGNTVATQGNPEAKAPKLQ